MKKKLEKWRFLKKILDVHSRSRQRTTHVYIFYMHLQEFDFYFVVVENYDQASDMYIKS